MVGKYASKPLGGGGGDGGQKGGKTRRLPIQRWTDVAVPVDRAYEAWLQFDRSEEHTSELQSRFDLVCRLLLEKKKYLTNNRFTTSASISSLLRSGKSS